MTVTVTVTVTMTATVTVTVIVIVSVTALTQLEWSSIPASWTQSQRESIPSRSELSESSRSYHISSVAFTLRVTVSGGLFQFLENRLRLNL